MDDFLKSLKDRFSFDNVISFMKDAKLVDDAKEEPKTITENIADIADEIPRTTMLDVDGTPIIITGAGSISQTKIEESIAEKSGFSILQKSSSHEVKSDTDSTKTETSEIPVKKPIDVPLFF